MSNSVGHAQENDSNPHVSEDNGIVRPRDTTVMQGNIDQMNTVPPEHVEQLNAAYNLGLKNMYGAKTAEINNLKRVHKEFQESRNRHIEQDHINNMNQLVYDMDSNNVDISQKDLVCAQESSSCVECLEGLGEDGDTMKCESVIDAYVSCAREHSDMLLNEAVAITG